MQDKVSRAVGGKDVKIEDWLKSEKKLQRQRRCNKIGDYAGNIAHSNTRKSRRLLLDWITDVFLTSASSGAITDTHVKRLGGITSTTANSNNNSKYMSHKCDSSKVRQSLHGKKRSTGRAGASGIVTVRRRKAQERNSTSIEWGDLIELTKVPLLKHHMQQAEEDIEKYRRR